MTIIDTNFWLNRWKNNEIGFHESEANPLLVKCFPMLSLKKGSRVFLPLCGKTRDIAWLLSQGYAVAGAELSQLAVEQLFAELYAEPEIIQQGELRLYRAKNLDIFVGDLFQLSGSMLGSIDAIYDRGALVALPEEIRSRYSDHLMKIAESVPQLLITYEYDQNQMDGPPFSISQEEVEQHYAQPYQVKHLSRTEATGPLRKRIAAQEEVWLLTSINSV
ncbi:thiopurine S-methyltransferase [Tunicatimonas pelagia]|uniref:thiopurine S-methyltransferase n=1 Tax=Tunicatimonas pelagia TaxID=931531 RepID=UPI00266501B9|nr:thiopurine S-methyltransferase [Tunicatimonas pelagia]WKN43014.1 thiopurine S-methyltransferase [Tunicatimonas pelagia]